MKVLLVLCLLVAASAAVAPVKLIKDQCQVSFKKKGQVGTSPWKKLFQWGAFYLFIAEFFAT